MSARRKGRPPIGSQAMSGAERARRYRQRLAQLGKQGTLISRQGFQWPRAAMAAFAKSWRRE